MQTPALTTELEAVNLMLSLIGESPVNSLVPPYIGDVAHARALLLNESRDVQAEGWAFNQETDVTLARNNTNQIVLAPNVVSVDADTDPGVDVVQRAGKLYDRKNHTFVFDHDLHVEIMYQFPFDELPECARRYILIRAGRCLQARWVGSEQQHMFTKEKEDRARVTLMHEEGDTADINILNDPHLAYTTRRWTPRRYSR